MRGLPSAWGTGSGSGSDVTSRRGSERQSPWSSTRAPERHRGERRLDVGYTPYGLRREDSGWGGDGLREQERTPLWRMQHERAMFDERMGEEGRRYDQGFAQDRERFERTFGEDTRRYDEGVGEDTRRYDEGVGEDLRRFELSQDAFDTSQARGEEALGQYDQLFNTPLAELGQYEQAIIDQSTPGQEQARQATISALARQGVRGPQAALETSRQAGMMSQGMQNQLAGRRFQEALDRRGSRGKMRGEMALQGLGGGL